MTCCSVHLPPSVLTKSFSINIKLKFRRKRLQTVGSHEEAWMVHFFSASIFSYTQYS